MDEFLVTPMELRWVFHVFIFLNGYMVEGSSFSLAVPCEDGTGVKTLCRHSTPERCFVDAVFHTTALN